MQKLQNNVIQLHEIILVSESKQKQTDHDLKDVTTWTMSFYK